MKKIITLLLLAVLSGCGIQKPDPSVKINSKPFMFSAAVLTKDVIGTIKNWGKTARIKFPKGRYLPRGKGSYHFDNNENYVLGYYHPTLKLQSDDVWLGRGGGHGWINFTVNPKTSKIISIQAFYIIDNVGAFPMKLSQHDINSIKIVSNR